MKISTQQYAQTLFELTDGKTDQEISNMVTKFAETLKKDGQLKNADRILEKFSEIYNRRNGIVKAEIKTRYKIQDTRYKEIESYIKNKYEAKSVELVEVVDENIKGGIMIRVGDEVTDATIEGRLKKLKKELVKQ